MDWLAGWQFGQGEGRMKTGRQRQKDGFSFDRGNRLGECYFMSTLYKRIRKLKANSFTLVELLVVISIIGLLAGLSVPAIQGGLDKAKQQTDVSNIRQLGMILFADAMENEGSFATGNGIKDVVTNLIANGLLNSPKILSGTGFKSAASTNAPDIVSSQNIAWVMLDGMTVSSNGLIPLLISRGVQAPIGQNLNLQAISTGWRDKGVVVYRIQNSAEFIRSGTAGAAPKTVNTGLDSPVGSRIME